MTPTKKPGGDNTPKIKGAQLPYTKKDRLIMGETLRDHRVEQNVTQTELAHAIGYRHQANVSQIERGLKSFPSEKLLKAARYLGIRPDALKLKASE